VEVVRSIHAAENVVCAIAVSGAVFCKSDWAAPDSVAPPRKWEKIPVSNAVALGGNAINWNKSDGESSSQPFWFAVLEDGSVQSFEVNLDSTVGSVRAIAGITKAKQVAVGEDHACALVDHEQLKCWHHMWSLDGSDDRGPRPPKVERPAFVDAVSAEGQCIRRAGGERMCLVSEASWSSALAHGRRAQFAARVGVPRIRDAPFGSCEIFDDGRAQCEPPWTLGAANIADVSWGAKHVCALTRDGQVTCAAQ